METRVAAFLMMLALSSGCAFETRSLASRGLVGDGGVGPAGAGGADGGGQAGNGGGGGRGGNGGHGGEVEPECTPGTERSACDNKSCHPVTLVCTSMELESRGPCDACYADSNCADPSHRCVKMSYAGSAYPESTTGFCLPLAEPEGANCTPPFVVVLQDRESMSGPPLQSYCGIQQALTTCDAVRAFHTAAVCPTGRDDQCPFGGICRAVTTQGNQTEFRCTYPCADSLECSTQSSTVSCAGYCGG